MSASGLDQAFVDYFEDAKAFLELAKKCKKSGNSRSEAAYARAALLVGFASFEAYLRSVASDFIEAENKQMSVHDRAFLMELEVSLDPDGAFEITKKAKYSRLEDRILFIYRRFSGKKFDLGKSFWSEFLSGIPLRNAIVHPKEHKSVSIPALEKCLTSILAVMDYMSRGIYKKALPLAATGLSARIDITPVPMV